MEGIKGPGQDLGRAAGVAAKASPAPDPQVPSARSAPLWPQFPHLGGQRFRLCSAPKAGQGLVVRERPAGC